MAARSIEDQLAQLDAFKAAPISAETTAALDKALTNKSNVIVAKAAMESGILKIASLADALSTAFARFLAGNDKGCLATTAIVKALATMELCDEATFLAGARHVQMEPAWGGSKNAAVELRCESVAALVRAKVEAIVKTQPKLRAAFEKSFNRG